MTDVHVSSALLENFVSAGPMNAIKSFASVYDQDYHPMLIYIDDTDSKLKALHRNAEKGYANEVTVLSTYTGVMSFKVVQNYDTRDMFLALHFQESSTDWLVCYGPADPRAFLSGSATSTKLKDRPFGHIHLGPLGIGPFGGSYQNWPCIVTIPEGDSPETVRMRTTDDQFATIDFAADHSHIPDSYTLLDMKCAMVDGEHGMWTLEKHTPILIGPGMGSTLELKFWRYDKSAGQIMVKRAILPPRGRQPIHGHKEAWTEDARIAVIKGQSNLDEVLLIANGLHHYSSDDPYYPKNVSYDKAFARVTEAFVVQRQDKIRLWLEVPDETGATAYLTYSKFSSGDLANGFQAGFQSVPMIEKHRKGLYSALPSAEPMAHDQWFFHMSTDNKIKATSQSSKTGLWSGSENYFFLPDIEKIIHLNSYTTQVTFDKTSGDANALRKIRFSSGDIQTATINGVRHTFGGGSPVDVEVPAALPVTIVQETTDLTVRTFSFEDVTPGAVSRPIRVDTATDAIKKLELHNVTADQLRKWGADPSIDLEEAAKQFQSLGAQGARIDSSSATHTVALFSLGSMFEEGLHWLEQKGAEVAELVVDAAGAAAQIIIKVGNWIKHFAIDSWHAIGRVARALLDHIKLGWDWLRKKIGEVFDWAKIMETTRDIHTSIVAMRDRTKTSLDKACGIAMTRMDAWLDKVEHDLDGYLDKTITNTSIGASNVNDKAKRDEHGFMKSAKMSTLTSAFNAPSPDATAKAAQANPLAVDDKVLKVFETCKARTKDDGFGDKLKKLIDDIKDLLSAPITAQSLTKVLKDAFAICFKAAKETINGFIEFFRTAVDALLALLDQSIEIPIITPLLRWIAKDDSGWALPSPFMIVSFLMAVMQVESHALGITPWPTEKHTFDMAAGLPDSQAMSAWTTTSFSATPSPPNNRIMAAFYDNSTQSCQNKAWESYVSFSAAAHPLLLGAQMLGSGFTAWLTIAKGTKTGLLGGAWKFPLWVLELIDAAASFVDLTCTFPPFETDVWPAWEFSMIGYSLSIAETALSCIGVAVPLIRKLDDVGGEVEVILALIRSGLTIARVGLAGHAIHEQQESKADVWLKSGYNDSSMRNLAIGNIVCEGVGALARFAISGAVYYVEEHPDPASLTAAGVIIALGALFNTGATAADWSVDVVKSDKEYKENNKCYVGSGRR